MRGGNFILLFNNYKKNATFYKQALLFMLPIITQSLVETIINLTNNFVVGQFGDTNTISGVASSANVYDLVWYIFLAVVATGNIFTSQYLGINNHQKIKETTNIKLIYLLVISIFFILILQLFSNQIISIILGNNSSANYQDAINAGAKYSKLISWNYPLLGFAYIMSLTMNAVGNIKIPFRISIFSLVLNTILTCCLSLPIPGMPNLTIYGLAISLIVTRAVECILYIAYFIYKRPDYAPNINIFKVSKHLHVIYFKAFVPMLIGQITWGFYFILQTSLYSYFGNTNTTSIIAATQITNTVMAIFYSNFRGYTALVSYYVGTKLGASEFDAAREDAKRIIQLSAIISVVVSFIIVICAFWIPPLLFPNLSPAAKTLTTWFLGFNAITYFFINMLQPLYSFLYAGGYTLIVTLFDFVLVYFIDLFVTFALLKWSSLSIENIMMISCVSKFIDFITSYVFYKIVPWSRKIVHKEYNLEI